jgi:spore maturation protein CgeB
MANIIISFCQFQINSDSKNIVCYYEQLIKVLTDNGNNIFVINVSFFLNKYKAHLKKQIDEFNPDLIIAFNNQKPDFLDDDYECPIIIYDADSIELFNDVAKMKENIDRYYFFSICKEWTKNYLALGAKKEKVFFIPPATILKPLPIKYDKNIAIIASYFNNCKSLADEYDKYDDIKCDVLEVYKKYLADNSSNSIIEYIYKTPEFIRLSQKLSKFAIWGIFDNREYILNNILDLGLTIYGANWENVKQTNPMLFATVKKENAYTIAHNEEIYNSSKLCINIQHPQTKGFGYSWRCMDIMATNGCLVSSPASELKEQTKDFVDIPFFKNQFDVRDVCKKLLDNENMRRDIVLGCQEYVKNHHELYDRFTLIQQILSVPHENRSVNGGGEVQLGEVKYILPYSVKQTRTWKKQVGAKIFSKLYVKIALEKG